MIDLNIFLNVIEKLNQVTRLASLKQWKGIKYAGSQKTYDAHYSCQRYD